MTHEERHLLIVLARVLLTVLQWGQNTGTSSQDRADIRDAMQELMKEER